MTHTLRPPWCGRFPCAARYRTRRQNEIRPAARPRHHRGHGPDGLLRLTHGLSDRPLLSPGNPCSGADKWSATTKLKFSLTSSALLKETGVSGSTLDTCTESQAEGEITNAGSSGETVTGPINSLTWGSCTFTTTTLAPGKLEVESIAGTHSGTVKADAEIKVTISIPLFGSCVYGFTSGNDLGTLTEGKPASFDASAVATKRSGSSIGCPETANWTASYTLTEPKEKTLSVEPS